MTRETVKHESHEVVADLGTSKIISRLLHLRPFGKFSEKEDSD
ncbi:MAG: hypothetical protein ABH834_02515 [Candidatus Altiarchaeota archaeon]